MKVWMTLSAAALAVCGSAVAQFQVDRISVHFATPVSVAGSLIPAGDCNIQVLRGSSANVVLKFQSEAPEQSAILVQVNRLSNSNVEVNGHASVVLSHNSKGYQLEQIVLADQTGFQVID